DCSHRSADDGRIRVSGAGRAGAVESNARQPMAGADGLATDFHLRAHFGHFAGQSKDVNQAGVSRVTSNFTNARATSGTSSIPAISSDTPALTSAGSIRWPLSE